MYFDTKFFKPLEQAKFENNSVYWYDQHDWAIKQTPFNQFLDQPHWEHLQHDPTSKILMFYGDEYYNLLDIQDWVTTLKTYNIKPQQLYLLCLDENWVTWTKKQFDKVGYNGVNIQSYNLLMSRVDPQQEKPIVKRFSVLSRNYSKWRLRLYATLLNQNLLTKNFNYTFNNVNPYGITTVYPREVVKKDLVDLGFTLTSVLEKWINGMPYSPKNHKIEEKLSDDVYNIIQTSGINLVVESHFDPFWNFQGQRTMNPQDFSPSFPTEKMYKPIACHRPFIVFSTPWFLKEFKSLGYKTFHPYIDERYDNIQNDVERLHAITKEVERICNLSDSDFINLMENCRKITEHNFKTMERLKNTMVFNSQFDWLEPYLNKNYKLI